MAKSVLEAGFPFHLASDVIKMALQEDLGLAGDVTGTAVIDADERMSAEICARQAGVIAGLPLAVEAFQAMDLVEPLVIEKLASDGDRVDPGDCVLRVSGNSRAILAAERVALNFLGHLSGIASLTRKYVDKTAGSKAAICCTRKTLPGLRAFQKYAVRAGGGQNHRFGLDDAVLIKDNHIASAGGVTEVLQRVRQNAGHMLRIEIEVDTLEQLQQVMSHKVDVVLLDNMSNEQLRDAIEIIDGRAIAEASGGVNLDTVAGIAKTGVDLISVGALTHSAPVLDLGLDIAAINPQN
jgi:nicotinate-nucleotide pyrophosphorylase (carboxylating)